MGCCLGRRRASALRQVPDEPVVEEEPSFENESDHWASHEVWEREEGDPPNTFNVLAVFTSDCEVDGPWPTSAIEREQLLENVRESIDQMNESFERSQVQVRGSLVAIVRFVVPPPFWPADYCRDAMVDAPVDTTRMNERQLAEWNERSVAYTRFRTECLRLRAKHQAHVLLIVNGGGDPISGRCGATNRQEATAVVPYSKLLHEFTPAHEIGHLFGCEHDRKAANAWGHAGSNYGYCAPHWRTIMAYNPHEDRYLPVIGHFSNPAVSYDDRKNGAQPTGTANEDNAAQLDLYTPTILGLRG
jgi:hypothetical protein